MHKSTMSALRYVAACSFIVIQGCTTIPFDGKPAMDKGLQELTDNTVTRMKVTWTEHEDHAYMLPSYNVMGQYFHWSENSNQYRWIRVIAQLRRDKFGQISRHARIPDSVPLLHTGDIVDVYLPRALEMNYDRLQAPIVLKLVCKNEDSACKEQNEKEVGKLGMEVISRGMPDMAHLTFMKKYDRMGLRLKDMSVVERVDYTGQSIQ